LGLPDLAKPGRLTREAVFEILDNTGNRSRLGHPLKPLEDLSPIVRDRIIRLGIVRVPLTVTGLTNRQLADKHAIPTSLVSKIRAGNRYKRFYEQWAKIKADETC
jgi:hypothetical protein